MAKVVKFNVDIEELGSETRELLRTLSVDEGGLTAFEVATGTTDGAVGMLDVTTASIVFFIPNQSVSFKINAGSVGITINANGILLLGDSSVTSVTVTNASGATALIVRGIWGT